MGPQEDYIETVFTCEGDYHDPHLKDRLEDFQKSLKDLLLTDKKKLILKKVEPWNSVRVTFKIPREAASRLKQLAQQGNATLRELGVLAVKIEDQNISLTIAGRNNERTQLVFRTGDAIQATTPSVSVYNTNSPSLDEIGPQGPGPSHVDVTSKNIADYLRQGPSLLDSLFNQQLSDRHMEGTRAKVNSILTEHGLGQHRTFQQTASKPSHHNNPSTSSPSVNSVSPSRSPVGSGGLKFPQLPGMPPGLPPGMPPGPPRHALDNLPPPPPYPEGSSYMNNLQKLRLSSAGTSPLLVNLLQNDPSLSSLLGAGRLPPNLDPDLLQPPKKKRKPRKPKEKKKKEGELMSVPNAVIPGTSTEVSSVASLTASTHTTSAVINRNLNPSVKEQGFQNVSQALIHGKNIQTEQNLPLTSPGVCRKEECDTTGKIINPVTGLLEPMDLSDTSPSKSEGDKNSPRSLMNKVGLTGDHRLDSAHGDVGRTAELQGRLENPNQGIQKQLTEQLNSHSVASSEHSLKPFSSSHISKNVSIQKHYPEGVKNDMLTKGRLKNDIMPSHSNLEQIVPKSEHEVTKERPEDKCDNLSALELTKKADSNKSEKLPQENDSTSIPLQLLNKPLLQIKHDSMIKSSGSPDSNGDSECSNLDTQNGPETGSHPGPHLDVRCYNNDSGVGSCSERSDDTPSEHGDNDFKSGNHNSFECAKTPNIDSLKQAPPPNAKNMIVGFALEETQKNHKHVTEKAILNSVFERVKMKSEKMEMCSTSQSQQLHNNWSDESLQFANNVENRVKQAVYESIHRKSPKMSTNLPNSLHHAVGGQFPMQGSESSMQKKKSSPRNSPRGNCSPRNPSSPRNPGSPRGGGSPRSSEQTQQGSNNRQSFRTNQEVPAHMSSRESHSKSPYSELNKSEQRRSPFHMLSTPHSVAAAAAASMSGILGAHMNHVDALHHGGVEPCTVSPQCNIDSIALLKSFEAYAQPHLSQLMAANKDPGFLQKLEDLKPFFQKLQQHAASRTAATSVANGLENLNHTSRSQSAMSHLTKSSVGSTVTDIHSVSESPVMPNSLHAGQCNTNVLTSLKNDKESNSLHTKVNKVVTEEQKIVSSVSSRRSSPGAATSTSVSMHSFDSSLPPPKRLTESVQKLFPLPLFDTSLPHVNRRSPSSSASVTRTSSSHMAPGNANTRGSAPLMSTSFSTSNTRNFLAETSVLDIDSITPSITAVSIGPIDFHSDTSRKVGLDAINLEHKGITPSLSSVDSQPVSMAYPGVVSSSATKLVPAVTGSIPSHKLGDSGGNSLNSSVTQYSSSRTETTSSSLAVSSVNEIKTPLCNSETKMAGNSAVQSKSNNCQTSSSGLGPPVLHPQTVSQPLQLNLDKSKSRYSQMGLSEMLQETANLPAPTAATTTSHPVQPIKTPTSVASVSSGPDKTLPVNFIENLQSNIEPQRQANSPAVETKKLNCDEKSEKQKDSSNAGTKVGVDDSDIPKLKRQPSLSFSSKPGPVMRSTLSSDSCDSDLNRSQDSCSSNNLTPPVLIAVSEFQEGKSASEKDPLLVKSEVENHTENTNLINTSIDIQSPTGSTVNTGIENVTEGLKDQAVDVTEEKPLILLVNNDTSIISGINSIHEDSETSQTVGVQRQKSLRKRRASSESIEEKSEGAARQLRSRKRTNTCENDGNVPEDAKKLKLDPNTEVSNKTESAKDKNVLSAKPSYVSPVQEAKIVDEPNTQTESIKAGLRTRTNSKNMQEEKPKLPAVRESRKDSKVVSGKGVVEKKAEVAKIEEMKRNQQTRRNRQSPSAPALEKQAGTNVVREKSPLRGSRTRGRNSPVVMENCEESQENKRTTRSAKSKETKAEGTTAPAGKVTAANKRRRTSQDHR
ncbi:uncharacterized protein LOC123524965 isoform X2 [Mercenaria mercenaria]|nr:uncharacterized protein LOC123524965 isoform X2 [Mercenaria mercenaria]